MLKITFKFFTMCTVFAAHNSCFAQNSTFSGIPAKPPTNFGSFNNFPNAVSSGSTTSDDIEQPIFSFSPVNTFSPSTASTSASIGSSSQTSQPSTNSSPLETFISTFTNAIDTSPILSDALDFSQLSPQWLEDFMYHALHVYSKSRGITDPEDIAKYASQPVADNLEVLTYPVIVRIDANAMGKYLLSEGILNDMNAASLALDFANAIETSAKQTVEKDVPESKVQAVFNGYVGFFEAHGLFTREKLPVAGKYFTEELRLAGKQFGRKRSS